MNGLHIMFSEVIIDFYSIESIDIEDQSHDNNEIQYVSIRNNVFSESNF